MRLGDGVAHAVALVEVNGKGRSEHVDTSVVGRIVEEAHVIGDAIAQQQVALAAPHDDDLAQGEQLMTDHLDGRRSHQSVAVAGEEHWSVHHRLGLVTPQGTHNGFQYLRVSNHTYLHRLGHHIIDDGVELSAYNGSRQIIEMLDTQGILQGHRGDDRHGLGAECRYRGDVGLNARSTCTVATRDGKYCRITH